MTAKLFSVVVSPPAVAYVANDQEGGESQVDDACIQCFSGFFAQLLGCFCADGTLGPGGKPGKEEE